MPELPEVEITRRALEPILVGRKIEVEILDLRLVRTSGVNPAARVSGSTVTGLRRQGKYLLMDLDSGDVIVVHLRMTGRFQLQISGEAAPRYARALFRIVGDGRLFLVDMRRLGELFVLTGDEIATCRRLSQLGPDPLSADFTVEALRDRLSSRSGAIKQVLMNQQVIAGVGNIYAQECLHRAGIHPGRAASRLNREEIHRVHESLQSVLMDAISCGGSSINTYRSPLGDVGQFGERFTVYGRAGKLCPRCGGMIERCVIGGRGTYLCKDCQK